MDIYKPGFYFCRASLQRLLILILAMVSCLNISANANNKAEKRVQSKAYFELPYIPRDASQNIILVELESSKNMLKRAYSSAYFGAHQRDGQVGYFNPERQYRYHSAYQYFEEDSALKQGHAKAWDGRFLNWLLMRQTDMTRYLLLGVEAEQSVIDTGLDEIIELDKSKQEIILQNVQGGSYSPIPNYAAIKISNGQIKYQDERLQLRLKSSKYHDGLLGLLTKNVDLYFYAQEAQEFIFGDAKELPAYLKNKFLSETKLVKTKKYDQMASLSRALEEIKQYSLSANTQSEICQRYVYLSLTTSGMDSPLLTNQHLLSDCQKGLRGKQALTHFQLLSSDRQDAILESFDNKNEVVFKRLNFHGASALMNLLFEALYFENVEGSFQISGADMEYFPDQSAVVYQALFKYSNKSADKYLTQDLYWLGDLKANFVDTQGRLRSDNGDKQLGSLQEDPIVSTCYDEKDKQLRVRFLTKPETEASCNILNYPYFEEDIGRLWQASDFLNALPQVGIDRQRTPFQNSGYKRYIRTHIGQTEYDFIAPENIHASSIIEPEWLNVNSQDDANKLIAFVRGQDQSGFRHRQDGDRRFLLGDTANSKPVLVAQPASNYHLLYADKSYQTFFKQYQQRRSRVFLGSNDGMLHSFNAGWFDNTSKQLKGSPNNANKWQLGQEIWAFVPSKVLPYLQQLSDQNYGISPYHHLQISPQTPYVFDARIFSKGSSNAQKDRVFKDQNGHQMSVETHPDGWGTLMLVGVGLGVSSYLLFDITDAEQAPKLMAELTIKDTVSANSLATVMTQKNKQGEIQWKLVLGSGLESSAASKKNNERSAGIYIYDLQEISSGSHSLKANYIDLKAHGSYVTGVSAADWNLDAETDALYVNTAGAKKNTGSLYRVNIASKDIGGTSLSLKATKLLDVQAALIERPQLTVDAMNNRWIYLASADDSQIRNTTLLSSDKAVINKIIGLKEPRDINGAFLLDNPQGRMDQTSTNKLLEVSAISVEQDTGKLSGTWALYPKLKENTVQQLERRLMQFSESSAYLHGWVRSLADHEVSTGPNSLFAGFLTQASYQADYKNCRISADAYVHRLRFTTGTSWYSPRRSEYKAKKAVAQLKSTKSTSQGSKELTSLLLQKSGEQIHQIQSSSNGHTKSTLEEDRKLIKNGEVSWREL